MDDVATVLAEAGRFSTLMRGLAVSNLRETLEGEGPWTVFAPPDEAFQALGHGDVERLLHDADRARNVLTYHVSRGRHRAEDLPKDRGVKTVNGHRLPVDTAGGLHVGKARVTQRDLPATNGLVHVIDQVLFPPS